MKSALKEAKDLKLTKEGEVTILRKGMEKAAQEHTTQIARLKAEKEGADAKQLQVQKETKEEIERMRTQIIFKQQEIESTLRRVPSSARANRINRDPLRTPARRSSQAIGDTPGPNRLKLEQSQPLEEQHIETPKSRRFRSPKNASYSGILPGFQNAFSASPIARLRVDVAGQESPPSCSSTRLSPPSSPTARLVRNQGINAHTDLYQHNSHAIIDNDSETMVMDEEENNQEVETMGQPISWTSELSRIILTHALPNSTRPTLQLLLATSALAVEANAFQFATACSEIFEVIAGPSGTMDYTITVRKLCDPLVTMLFVVGCSEQNYTIQSLINLLTALVLSLPDFGSHLLQASDNMQSSFSAAIREIIIHHLGPAKKSDALANETLGLLEALCLRNRNNIISR
ncbi:hypothetical protein AX15_006843 [Amanita polypyramis BW_CC]|nr:hypothetical protein AX15_006843 [Amanita polypyramis BW_CC]